MEYGRLFNLRMSLPTRWKSHAWAVRFKPTVYGSKIGVFGVVITESSCVFGIWKPSRKPQGNSEKGVRRHSLAQA